MQAACARQEAARTSAVIRHAGVPLLIHAWRRQQPACASCHSGPRPRHQAGSPATQLRGTVAARPCFVTPLHVLAPYRSNGSPAYGAYLAGYAARLTTGRSVHPCVAPDQGLPTSQAICLETRVCEPVSATALTPALGPLLSHALSTISLWVPPGSTTKPPSTRRIAHRDARRAARGAGPTRSICSRPLLTMVCASSSESRMHATCKAVSPSESAKSGSAPSSTYQKYPINPFSRMQ